MENSKKSDRNLRRPKGITSSVNVNILHLRTPWVVVWWSFAFPGFGHIRMGSYLKGFILVLWEFYINLHANINTAIFYSFTGQFELAKSALNKRWFLLYVAVYIYSIWETHRIAVELNKFSTLADRENSYVIPAEISFIEINFIEKRNPWVTMVWSLLMPGIGQLNLKRLSEGFFILITWITCVYFSHLLDAIHFTAVGAFSQATAILNLEWFLFLPSIYCFAARDSYVSCVEYNKMFEIEQVHFLRDHYQSIDFIMPV